ncbi:DUF1800 domain-containing protein [Luedemannella helvata]|uniref:DUF1800 domain-containing protein n=1 Tax=Luedemannella helvata TaxID=349315 RepID=A0ABN2KUE9_9ACTN
MAGQRSNDTAAPDGDAALIDLIFPNRDAPRQQAFEPTAAQFEQLAGFGPEERHAFRHRRVPTVARWLRRGRPVRTVRTSAPVRAVRGRRRVLLRLGGGAAAVAGVAGAAVAVNSVVGALTRDTVPAGPPIKDINALAAGGVADTLEEAARIAGAAIAVQLTPLSPEPALHLLKRATFGPTLPDLLAVRQLGLDAWLERQLHPKDIADPEGERIASLYRTTGMSTAQIRGSVKQYAWDSMYELGHATLARQMWSSRQLYEVMVDFWANHLNVTNPFDGGWDVRAPYDKDVIRKHALGRFSAMLHDSARHPAMLRYLDNASSDRRNVNENYGREVLELHTVGVEAKYTQRDVRHSAYIMTGRTVDQQGKFRYEPYRHWTGKVKVLGFTHKNASQSGGLAVGDAYLNYLAKHPKTARRIAHKLAVRFVTDRPPKELVDRLAKAYLDNNTAIVPVLKLLFRSVEFWVATGLKTRRPLENLVATARVLGVRAGSAAKETKDGVEGLYWLSDQLGQTPLGWLPPDGYPDVQTMWNSAHATLGVWNSHRALAEGWHKGVKYPDPEQLVGLKPKTVGEYVDKLSQRLVFQKMSPAHRKAVLAFLGAKESTKVRNLSLDGKAKLLVPMILDSVYHGLR